MFAGMNKSIRGLTDFLVIQFYLLSRTSNLVYSAYDFTYSAYDFTYSL